MHESSHPNYTILERYLAAKLSAQARMAIKEHITGCKQCQWMITHHLAMKLGLLRLGPNEPVWLD